MLRTVLISFFLFFFMNDSMFAKSQMILFTKDGKQLVLEEESKKENSILLSKSFKYKGTSIDILNVDSVRVEDALYRSIVYKNNMYMARLLFSGANNGYKIHYEGQKIIVISVANKEEYVPVTKTNKIGVYNYLFPECFKKDSNLFRLRSNTNDDNITKEITKTINCEHKQYVIYKKPVKIDVYIAPTGGIALYKPSVKSDVESSLFNYDKVKPLTGYTVGGKIGFILNDRLDMSVFSTYFIGKASLKARKINEFYTVRDTADYTGIYNNKSVDFGVDFKYIILKSKLSPTVSAGIYFSNKLSNNAEYKYTYNNGLTYVNAKEDLAERVIGLNIGIGINYKPITRIKLFLDTGYRIGIGFLSPAAIINNEGCFYVAMGVGVKLNK